MKASDLRDRTAEELVELESKLRKELMETRFRRNSGQLKNKWELRSLRRDIARVVTVLKEKQ
ncbi:MAG: 50S ribosomal protein L29 [Deltaproteobacteria bacterium]|nr:MAG: 50S ribosomal protein L29 [Deltaproteobacteria bacterium]